MPKIGEVDERAGVSLRTLRHALLRDLAQYAAEAQEQRHRLAEKLNRADRFITTLQDENGQAEDATVAWPVTVEPRC